MSGRLTRHLRLHGLALPAGRHRAPDVERRLRDSPGPADDDTDDTVETLASLSRSGLLTEKEFELASRRVLARSLR